jgi:GT2 family glycosyltransferase
MDVSVVITCWNGRKLLEKNLPLVLKASANSKNKIKEIIVVDDASSDDSVFFLKEKFPEVKVVKHQKNQGYSAVCNTGVKAAGGDLVVILNTDVIPSETFLENALPHFKNSKVFAVTFNEGTYGPGKLVWKNGFWEIEATEVPSQTCPTDWSNGGSSIFRKEIWQSLGGMDQLFLPFYFEDVDLGLRARKQGYECLWEPKAKVIHAHEATINPKKFAEHNHRKNISLIKERNFLLLNWKSLEKPADFITHFLALSKKTLSHPGYVKVIFLAVVRKISYSFQQ